MSSAAPPAARLASVAAPALADAPLVTDNRLRMIIFILLMTAMFMATLDNQIVSTALPTIVAEFGQLERFGWVGSAYLLASSAVMPVYGKLGDLFEPRERARYQSFSSLVLMASGALGPVLGGFLSDWFGWRSIFLVNLPIGILVLAGLVWLLPYRRPVRRPKIDYAGALLLAGAVASVVLWADSAELFGSLLAAESLGVVAFGLVCLLGFVLVERRVAEPVVPLGLFRNPTVGLLLIVSMTSGAVAIGSVNYIALFLQTTTGLSPTMAGLLFVATTGGIAAGSLSAGRLIARTGRYKWLAAVSSAGTMIALLLFSFAHAGTPIVLIALVMLMQGIAIGIGQQVPVIGVQNAASHADVGAATSTVTLTRMAGASIAISIYGAVIAHGMTSRQITIPGVANIKELSPKMLAALPPETQGLVAAAYATAFHPLFLTAAGIIGLGFVASLALKNVQLPQAVLTGQKKAG